VRLDVGHSGTDFRFSAARTLFEQGHLPTTISTDLNVFNVDHPVISLPETMSKIWALGVPLADVVAMVTTHTAEVIHRTDTLGALAPGREADITILEVQEGDVRLSDGFEVLATDRRLVPLGCYRAGEWIPSSPAVRAVAA
jgi:dihydroorotase